MLNNNYYDMVEEITELSKSISRMDTYIKDSRECSECAQLWSDMKKRQENELQMIYSEFEKHVKKGSVSV